MNLPCSSLIKRLYFSINSPTLSCQHRLPLVKHCFCLYPVDRNHSHVPSPLQQEAFQNQAGTHRKTPPETPRKEEQLRLYFLTLMTLLAPLFSLHDPGFVVLLSACASLPPAGEKALLAKPQTFAASPLAIFLAAPAIVTANP